jgi:hypothetical protein
LVQSFPEAKLLGLTASPERLDGRGLGAWFEHMVIGPGTSALIDQGYLSKFKYFAPSIPDLRGVRVKHREYDTRDLEKAVNTIVGDVIDHFKEKLAPNARALAFCVSVDASRELAVRFRAAGVPAKHVDWETPQTKRDQAVRDLASGKLRVLTNVEVFTEGFDLPAIDAVLLLRPTKSFALYRQMIGRCLRFAEGKSYTTILDHAGLIADHPFPDDDVEWSLSGRKSGAAQSYRATGGVEIRRCPQCTTVHKWSLKCPQCSYTYQIRDRTVEEVFGELRQLKQGAEYETQMRFARRCKLTAWVIGKYVKQNELTTYGPRRLIKIREGLVCIERLKENEAKCENQVEFGKRIGASPATVCKLVRKGLPTTGHSNSILVEDALEFLKRQGLLSDDGKYIIPHPQSRPGFDNRTSFRKRIGIDYTTLCNWIKEGLPINELGLIPIDVAMQWLRRQGLLNKDGKYINSYPQSRPGFDNQKDFANRIGTSEATVQYWIKAGLPFNECRLIPVEDALRWLRCKGLISDEGKYIRTRQSRPGFDTQKSFASRIGVSDVTVGNWIKKGLPVNKSRLIPVEPALRWVKENRPQHAKRAALAKKRASHDGRCPLRPPYCPLAGDHTQEREAARQEASAILPDGTSASASHSAPAVAGSCRRGGEGRLRTGAVAGRAGLGSSKPGRLARWFPDVGRPVLRRRHAASDQQERGEVVRER